MSSIYYVNRRATVFTALPADMRQAEEKERVADVKRRAKAPSDCSSEIIAAPARAGLSAFRESYLVAVGDDGFEKVDVRYKSGTPGVVRDIFDTMTDQGKRRGGGAPFTVQQVAAGREYRALHERVQSAGIKCSKAWDVQLAGQGGTDFMDAFMADAQRLGWFHAAIGLGVAKDTKRKVPAIEGKVRIGDVQLRQIGRKLITVRALVDNVCIHERSVSDVLRAHGWGVKGKNRMTLYRSLCAALGRMQGI